MYLIKSRKKKKKTNYLFTNNNNEIGQHRLGFLMRLKSKLIMF